ncbi:vitamin-B12 independent methionine synthase [Gordonia caeni]|uniref:vitamin-B12 independent methionine synthase n=1 Tax=Gordonia caeni TaxID=1007097 RepID=UPI0031D85738
MSAHPTADDGAGRDAFPAGKATGVGSMPGTDPREAAAVVVGELGLPHLPELPARGVGADLIGRTAGLLVDLPVDYVHRTYRLAAAPTAETRRARDWLRWDLDALEEVWETGGLRGQIPAVKVQACGPFTFAAHTELRGGHKLVRDAGALREVTGSLAAGLREQTAELERRLGVRVVVQLDEPSVGAVIDGTVTPLTRLDPIAPIPVADVAHALTELAEQLHRPVLVHDCSPPRWDLLGRLDSCAVSIDLTLLRERDLDRLGELLDAGRVLAAGVVPPADPGIEPGRLVDDLVVRLGTLVDRIGLSRDVLREQVLITPTCGLAGATPEWARTALTVASRVAEGIATS